MKIAIPARLNSTRLNSKPLIKVFGLSILERTYRQCEKAINSKDIIVLTDSLEIESFCKAKLMNVIIVDNECKTGTDRIALYASLKKINYIINVQGDEPLIDPKDIRIVIEEAKKNSNVILNGYKKITNKNDFNNRAIPKVVFDKHKNLMYMSRSPIPGNKNGNFVSGFKQVCIYGFPKSAIDFIIKNPRKSFLENIEDIEVLRFVESGLKVKMIELFGNSFSIDTKSDLKKLKRYLKINESS